MDKGSDALATMGWALRKYWWLVLSLVLLVGSLFPAAQLLQQPVYEAKAVVAADNVVIDNIDVLPRYGTVIFENGVVAREARDFLGAGAPEDVIPSKVELVAEQDNVAFTIIGRDAEPQRARRLANLAATYFNGEMNQTSSGISSYIVQSRAQGAEEAPRLNGPLSFVVGHAAGLLAGLGAVVLLVLWRRPVTDAPGAELTSGIPVLGQLRLVQKGNQAGMAEGIAPLCRRIVAAGYQEVMVVSPDKYSSLRARVTSAIAPVLGAVRPVRVRLSVQHSEGESPFGDPTDTTQPLNKTLSVIDAPTTLELATRSDASLTLLVVPKGTSSSTLRQMAAEYLDGGPAGLVLVSTRGGRSARPQPVPQPMQSKATAEPSVGGQASVPKREEADAISGWFFR